MRTPKQINKVYLLFHSHEFEDGRSDDKLIGVYNSRDEARRAQERAVLLDGFRGAPDGFVTDAYEINKDHWTDGYDTIVIDRVIAATNQV